MVDEKNNNEANNKDKPPIAINRRFTIYPGVLVPEFHAPPAMAYKVIDNENPNNKLHGLVCDPKLHPRLSILDRVNALAKDDPNIMTPLAWSVVNWEEETRECPVLIMQSERYLPFDFNHFSQPLGDDIIVNYFLRHTISTLIKFEDNRLTHRAIHLDNLYFFNELKRRIILGECLSTPPGLTQNAIYDTIDSALAVPLGKGGDLISDDVYAVGVIALSLANHQPLAQGLSEEEIIARKITYGSFNALHNPKVRLSSTMEGCLRKMLQDDRNERATPSELLMWLNGQNFPIESSITAKRSSKPFSIGNQNFFSASTLAQGMHKNWDASTKITLSPELKDWIQNNLSQTDVSMGYDKAISPFETLTVENQDRILGRTLIALHQQGPIRYRSYSTTIDGATRLITHFVHNSEARKIFRQMMSSGILSFWLKIHESENERIKAFHYRLEELYKGYIQELRKDNPIEGLNLLVYSFNNDLPCQSKIFERYFVHQPRHLLPAIETILDHKNDLDHLIDYQIICFLKARYSRSIHKEIRNFMISSVPEESSIAEAEILSKLQYDFHNNREFPNICLKLCEILEPSVKRHHSRSARRILRKEIQSAAEKGQIRLLIQIVSDKSVIENDKIEFNLARSEYISLLEEINFVDFNLKNLSVMVARVGGDISASASGILATIITLGYVCYWSLFI